MANTPQSFVKEPSHHCRNMTTNLSSIQTRDHIHEETPWHHDSGKNRPTAAYRVHAMLVAHLHRARGTPLAHTDGQKREKTLTEHDQVHIFEQAKLCGLHLSRSTLGSKHCLVPGETFSSRHWNFVSGRHFYPVRLLTCARWMLTGMFPSGGNLKGFSRHWNGPSWRKDLTP